MRILALSSFVPEHICDTIKFDSCQGSHSISHYCGYAADYISQVLRDESVDGAVYPKSCDSSRVITSYLEGTRKFIHQIHVPARQDNMAVGVFAESVRAYKEAVENAYGICIHDAELRRRCEVIGERNRQVLGLYEELENISFLAYLQLLHTLQSLPLAKHLEYIREHRPGSQVSMGKRIYLVGSRVVNMSVVREIEEAGMSVVGDNLTESKRMFSQGEAQVKDGIYKGISESVLRQRLSPTQNNFEEIIQDDMAEIRRKDARGVIFLTQKYCEPYDYLYSVYKRTLDGMGIPSLRISLLGTTGEERFRLQAEAFSDML
ncbi:MAG: 2-hydroxyacyl-CoA dehydratase family protein [Butyrivibrio sp.]|nr:2-hydroxyacyl-CoA dehydratase family protein [Acetatifactor muris]MCM1559370.1 2-hydroxyacyl-CoA dehydratase family protein [Butyrivibrio sp.]